jgi:starch-binding outer membrane protein, SusD/RagB family
MKKIFILITAILVLFIAACKKDFLNVPAQGGSVTSNLLTNAASVQQLLIGAYHDLSYTQGYYWSSAASNWMWGDITSGDAYLGGNSSSKQMPHGVIDGLLMETYAITPSVTYVFPDDKWTSAYDGVNRANQVIIASKNATDMTDAQKTEVQAEARFLRAHFHFEAKKTFNNVPYVDETVTNFKALPNTVNIWPNIEADFRYAFNNLPETQPSIGQANKWAAACFLAKCYMFEQNYNAAKGLLDTIILNGKNAAGLKYGLMPNFHDNFDVTTENNMESVFQVQFEEDANQTFGTEADLGESAVCPVMGYVGSYGGPDVGYGYWKQPSLNLVNAFKTDANGLPLLDGSFNNTNDIGSVSADPSDINGPDFHPYAGNLDPRLDWTVGRKGIPYLDWGTDPGIAWVANPTFGGPYAPSMKFINTQATFPTDFIQYYYVGSSTVNYSLIRYADVLLWAAECEVEAGSLDQAETYVNMIRNRAKSSNYVQNNGANAANYVINPYPAGAFISQDMGRNAVRFERRLELALEGHRFFDLVRWGIAATYINTYLQTEQKYIQHLQGIAFIQNHNEYFPIPQVEISQNPSLKQNPGY